MGKTKRFVLIKSNDELSDISDVYRLTNVTLTAIQVDILDSLSIHDIVLEFSKSEQETLNLCGRYLFFSYHVAACFVLIYVKVCARWVVGVIFPFFILLSYIARFVAQLIVYLLCY